MAETVTAGPWCYENIGEKENCIAIGTAWRYDDETFKQIAGQIDNRNEEGDPIYHTEAVC